MNWNIYYKRLIWRKNEIELKNDELIEKDNALKIIKSENTNLKNKIEKLYVNKFISLLYTVSIHDIIQAQIHCMCLYIS